jgi:hypothetical protein
MDAIHSFEYTDKIALNFLHYFSEDGRSDGIFHGKYSIFQG